MQAIQHAAVITEVSKLILPYVNECGSPRVSHKTEALVVLSDKPEFRPNYSSHVFSVETHNVNAAQGYQSHRCLPGYSVVRQGSRHEGSLQETYHQIGHCATLLRRGVNKASLAKRAVAVLLGAGNP